MNKNLKRKVCIQVNPIEFFNKGKSCEIKLILDLKTNIDQQDAK